MFTSELYTLSGRYSIQKKQLIEGLCMDLNEGVRGSFYFVEVKNLPKGLKLLPKACDIHAILCSCLGIKVEFMRHRLSQGFSLR